MSLKESNYNNWSKLSGPAIHPETDDGTYFFRYYIVWTETCQVLPIFCLSNCVDCDDNYGYVSSQLL